MASGSFQCSIARPMANGAERIKQRIKRREKKNLQIAVNVSMLVGGGE